MVKHEQHREYGEKIVDRSDNPWDSMADWAAEHPFTPEYEESTKKKAAKKEATKKETTKENNSKESVSGKTAVENDSFFDKHNHEKSAASDESREETPLEREWQKAWADLEEGEHSLNQRVSPEVFSADKKEVRKTLAPVIERLNAEGSRGEIAELLKLLEHSEKGMFVTRSVEFFAKVYGLKALPELKILSGADGFKSSGAFNSFTNELRLNSDYFNEPLEAFNTISHELWHVRQYQSILLNETGSSLLRINEDGYLGPDNELGYARYTAQLTELEAWEIGNAAAKIAKSVMREENTPVLKPFGKIGRRISRALRRREDGDYWES